MGIVVTFIGVDNLFLVSDTMYTMPIYSIPYHLWAKKMAEVEGTETWDHFSDVKFIDSPPYSLQCPICLSVLKEPHLLSCCGSHMCKVRHKHIHVQCILDYPNTFGVRITEVRISEII